MFAPYLALLPSRKVFEPTEGFSWIIQKTSCLTSNLGFESYRVEVSGLPTRALKFRPETYPF